MNAADLATVAATVGADDVLVFRPEGRDHYRNGGGVGRGAEWAGAAELTVADEPLAREALAARGVRRVARARPNHLAGPYYATTGALVAVGGDGVVALGPRLPGEVADAELLRAAERAAALVVPAPAPEVEPPALPDRGPDSVVAAATELLECELGVLFFPRTRTLVCCRRGRALPAESEIAEVMAGLAADAARLPLCCQDAGRRPLPAPLGVAAGVRSYLALAVGGAVLLVMHTDAAPRGFTTACLERARRLVAAAAP